MRWIALLVALGLPSMAQAATYNATTCSRADVGAAVALATHGDTVTIPSGDCTWTSQLEITVGLHLVGAGQASTTLRDGVTKDGTAQSTILRFNVASPNNFTVSEFKLAQSTADAFNKGHIAITGTSKAFRIHHITYTGPTGAQGDSIGMLVSADGDLWGLIDHITGIGYGGILICRHSGWGGHSWGDGSWAEQLYWGTEKAIYVEDSTMTTDYDFAPQAAFDAYAGCRAVIRHNTFTGINTGSHGLDSSQRERAVRSVEVYSNTYAFLPATAADFVHWFRGGTGVFYSNTITATQINQTAKHTYLRNSGSYTPWGQCNGSTSWDGNTAGENGYICADQPGAGTSRLLDSANPPSNTSAFANISDPIYVWNNTINGSANNCATFSCADDGTVKYTRDIIMGIARPSYSAYTYPHPLQSGGGGGSTASATITSPTAGTNQTASSSFAVSGTALAGNGSLTRVDVYIDGSLTCSDTVASFSPWTCNATAPSVAGTYVLTARATDADGQGPSSSGVSFTVPGGGGGSSAKAKFTGSVRLK